MPTSVVQHDEDAFIWPGTPFLCKLLEHLQEWLHANSWNHPKASLSMFWLDKPIDILPLVSRSNVSDGALTSLCPNPANNRLEAKTVLILSPQLKGRVRVLLAKLCDALVQIFFSIRVSDLRQRVWCEQGEESDMSSQAFSYSPNHAEDKQSRSEASEPCV